MRDNTSKRRRKNKCKILIPLLLAAVLDYTPVSSTVVFSAGEVEAFVAVATIDDDIAEPSEVFTAVLSNPSADLEIGPQGTATVTISDNDGMYDVDFCVHVIICTCSN